MPTSPATERIGRTAGGRASRCAGFALIELMLALAIVALLAALALPSSRFGMGASIQRYEAQRIAALLRADRNAALRSGRTVTTLLDLPRRRMSAGGSNAALDLSGRLALSTQPADLRGIAFTAEGRSSGGRLVIGGAGERRLAVAVNARTAAVEIGELQSP